MRAAAGEFDFDDRLAAILAGLPRAAVDLEISGEAARCAVAPDIISGRSTTFFDGSSQNFFDGSSQLFHFVGG